MTTTIPRRMAMILAVSWSACLVMPPLASAGAQTADSAAVVRTITRFHKSLVDGDSVAALDLLTGSVTVLESGGVETRAEYRSHHLPGDIAYAQAVKTARGSVSVVVHGDVAWATSTSTTEGEYKGRAINSAGAELLVLTRANGAPDGWRISAIHWSSRARRP